METFPSALYKRAGLAPADIANLVGVSRVTGYRWLRGQQVGVNRFLQARVGALSSAVEAAVEAGDLPDVEAMSLHRPAERHTRYVKLLKPHLKRRVVTA